MKWQNSVLPGLKAAAMGSLVGTSLPSVLVSIFAFIAMANGSAESVVFMFVPFLIGFALAIMGLVVIGLPITWWFRRRGEESRRAYLTAGLVGGGLFSAALAWMIGGFAWSGGILFFAFFGAATGGATGHCWWRYAREPQMDNDLDEISDVFG